MIDWHRPYGTVCGLAPICYQQDSRYYLKDGSPAPDEGDAAPNRAEPRATQPEPAPEPVPEPVEVPPWEDLPADVPEPVVALVKPKTDDMRNSANKLLKLQMEAYGEEWQGIEHARKFLGVKD